MPEDESELLYGNELRENKSRIRSLAVKQLLYTWKHARTRDNDTFLWGDEVECLLVRLNPTKHLVELVRPPWRELERLQAQDANPPSLQPELGCFMLETTPGKPFGNDFQDLLIWQDDLIQRRKLINTALDEDCSVLTLPYFPRFGTTGEENRNKNTAINGKNKITWSKLISDNDVTANVRYWSILRNVVHNRGENIDVFIPIYRDINTPWPWTESAPRSHPVFAARLKDKAPTENMIYMDTVMFGATGCSLQVTMQAKNIDQGRQLHDRLIPLGPIMLALTAGTPIFRGFLANVDSRWPCFEQCIDDRNEDERRSGKPSRSRVSSSTTYISQDPMLKEEYQTRELQFDTTVKDQLMKAGMDECLASHFAHIFSRNPLFASKRDLDEADETKTQVCDSLLSNVYQIVRFKPPSDDRTGWRVEFRPMETQLTDFENAAFCVFIILTAKTILQFDLKLYVPLKDVEAGMETAASINAAVQGRFMFRSNSVKESHLDHRLMSTSEIINGTSENREERFEGIIPLIRRYLHEFSGFDQKQRQRLEEYLGVVSNRASGVTPTTATWIREFVANHPAYNKDSTVSEEVTWDLIEECLRRTG